VEERDSQLLQPEPPRKGVCGACVARGWSIRRSVALLTICLLYIRPNTASFDLVVFPARVIHCFGMRVRPHVFSINARQLSQSTTIYPNQGRRHAGPGAARTTILDTSRAYFTHTSNMIFPHQCISTCICVNSSCQNTYTFKLPTPR
jgi:hypothetical protein